LRDTRITFPTPDGYTWYTSSRPILVQARRMAGPAVITRLWDAPYPAADFARCFHAEPQPIKQILRQRGISQQSIADDLEVTKSLISQVLAGASRSRRVEVALATALGIDARLLWPTGG